MIIAYMAPALRPWFRLWTKVLVVSCVGMVGLVLVVLWVLSGFHGLGLHAAVAVALLPGAVGSTALGVILMGLIFYSARSATDETAGGACVSARSRTRSSRTGSSRG
jgi:hypothetical protein